MSAVWTGPFSKSPRRGAPVGLFRVDIARLNRSVVTGGEVAHPPYSIPPETGLLIPSVKAKEDPKEF